MARWRWHVVFFQGYLHLVRARDTRIFLHAVAAPTESQGAASGDWGRLMYTQSAIVRESKALLYNTSTSILCLKHCTVPLPFE